MIKDEFWWNWSILDDGSQYWLKLVNSVRFTVNFGGFQVNLGWFLVNFKWLKMNFGEIGQFWTMEVNIGWNWSILYDLRSILVDSKSIWDDFWSILNDKRWILMEIGQFWRIWSQYWLKLFYFGRFLVNFR